MKKLLISLILKTEANINDKLVFLQNNNLPNISNLVTDNKWIYLITSILGQ